MALTRCAAAEAAPSGVRVNAVSPSLAEHPFLNRAIPDEDLAILRRRELFGRGAETWEMANVIVFLASDYSSYMSGEVISVSASIRDGGRSTPSARALPRAGYRRRARRGRGSPGRSDLGDHPHLVATGLVRQPGNEAVIDGDIRLTYAELPERWTSTPVASSRPVSIGPTGSPSGPRIAPSGCWLRWAPCAPGPSSSR